MSNVPAGVLAGVGDRPGRSLQVDYTTTDGTPHRGRASDRREGMQIPPARRIFDSLPMLIAVAVIPVVAAIVALMVQFAVQLREFREKELMDLAHTLGAAFDSELIAGVRLAETLAISDGLSKEGQSNTDWITRQMLRSQSQLSLVSVSDLLTETYVGHTELPPGATGRVSDLALSQGRLVAERKRTEIFGVRQNGPTAAIASIPIRAPIFDGEKVTRVLNIGLSPMYLSDLYRKAGFRDEMTGTLVDPNMVIAARNRNPEKYIGRRITPQLEAPLRSGSRGMFKSVNQEGHIVYTVFVRSELTGWSSVAAVPMSEIDDQICQAIMPVASLGLILVLVGVGSAIAVASRIRRSRKTIERAEAHTSAIVDSVVDGIVTVDAAGLVETFNPAAEAIFGYEAADVVGRSVGMLFAADHRAEMERVLETCRQAAASSRAVEPGREITGLRRNGETFPMELGIGRFKIGSDTLIVAVCRDISNRVQAENRIRQSLSEKETLLREVHHRVKNNLQIIASLLYFESQKLTDLAGQSSLADVRRRLNAMILVHEKLYRSKNLSRVELVDYVRSLMAEMERSYQSRELKVAISISGTAPELPIEQALPCGMIVAELTTNALKYAFPDGRPGVLEVEISNIDGRVGVTVRDNGVGMPEGFDPEQATSFGWRLVRSLTDQIGGSLALSSGRGTAVTVSFPYGEAAP